MSKSPEHKIQDKFCKHAAKLKTVLALKLVLLGLAGWPDATILHNGRVFFIEFKHGDNKLEKPQEYWRDILIGLGFKYFVCYTTEHAIEILTDQLRFARNGG